MLQISDLHHSANTRLQSVSENPKKLALIHTAIALGSSLFLTVITYLLSLLIADTGGLDGLGLRSILTTIQSVLEIAVLFALPFWQIGIFYVALQWSNGQNAKFTNLVYGFRRFRPVLGMLFLRSIVFIALGFAVFNISNILFMLTPFAEPFLELYKPLLEQNLTPEQLEALLTPEFTDAVLSASAPMLILFAVLFAGVSIPLFYRLRFSDFAVIEGLPAGKALLKSLAITRGSFLQVLKLDLSFWWFYLLQLLSIAFCYADSILPLFGIVLPISSTVAAFGFYAIGSACQCLLLWQYEAKRVTVYALAYHTLDGTINRDDTDIAS